MPHPYLRGLLLALTLAAAFTLETVYGSMDYEGEVRIA